MLLAIFLASALVFGLPGALADHPEVRIKSEGGTSTACVETDTCFEPSSVTVEVGGTVIMENTESPDIPILHTFTHGEAPPNQLPADERAFDSGFLAAGQSYEWVPDTPGVYPYFCLAHPWMLGTITVVSSDRTHDDREPVHMQTIRVGGFADPITYEITGGRVLSAMTDRQLASLILDIDAVDDGGISLDIPRTIIDTVEGYADVEYFVLVNSEESDFAEVSTTSTHRSLWIGFHEGADEIEIIGTHIGGIAKPPTSQPLPLSPQEPTLRALILNLRVVDNFGSVLDAVQAGQQAQITADITNNQNRDQSFVYIVDIKGPDGRPEKPKWISGSVGEDQSFSPSVSWTPDRPGRYVITANTESRYGSGDRLSPPVTLEISVSGISELERLPIRNPRLLDNFGYALGTIKVDQQIQIAADLTNRQSIDQDFAYIVKIRDARGVEVHDAWILGRVDEGRSYSPMLSWTPSSAGAYEVAIHVRSDNIRGDDLSPPARIPITVIDNGPQPREPPAGARMSISDPRVTDSAGNRLSKVDPGDLVQLTTTFRNNGDRFQEFTYVAEIQNGQDTERKHLKTQLGPKSSASSGISWTPKEHGTYEVTVSARPSAGSTENLAPPTALSVQVGNPVPATERMSLGRPTVGDGEIRPGQMVEVAGKITNNQDKDQRHVYIVQITDESGNVVYITWAVEDIAANGEFSPSISWRPEEPGRYEVTTYVWSSLVNTPEALAAPSTTVIHVAEPEDPTRPATEVVTVSTDKGSYGAGERITVRGKVDSALGFGIAIEVFAPDAGFNNVVLRSQPALNPDGTFETRFAAGGSLMKWSGEYTIRVEHGGPQRYGEATFQFTGGEAPATPPRDPDVTDTTIRVEGLTDLIAYKITGGKVLNGFPNPPAGSFVIGIEATADGAISLSMPRTILDSVQGGQDIGFFVIIDAEERQFTETGSTATHRVLNIPFSDGSTEIEILGTFVVS